MKMEDATITLENNNRDTLANLKEGDRVIIKDTSNEWIAVVIDMLFI